MEEQYSVTPQEFALIAELRKLSSSESIEMVEREDIDKLVEIHVDNISNVGESSDEPVA